LYYASVINYAGNKNPPAKAGELIMVLLIPQEECNIILHKSVLIFFDYLKIHPVNIH